MIPVLCIGETKEEYDKGLNKEVCAIQLAKGLSGVSADEMKNIVIAYEPVWAIGTGLTCEPKVAQKVHEGIRAWFSEKYSPAAADAMRAKMRRRSGRRSEAASYRAAALGTALTTTPA